jgi:hypothetical protein
LPPHSPVPSLLADVRANTNRLIKSESSQPAGHDTQTYGARTVGLLFDALRPLEVAFPSVVSSGPLDQHAVGLPLASWSSQSCRVVVALNSSSRFAKNTPYQNTFLELCFCTSTTPTRKLLKTPRYPRIVLVLGVGNTRIQVARDLFVDPQLTTPTSCRK